MKDLHNERQRDYFTGRALPRMTLDLAHTPYVQRHVDEVLRSVGASPGQSVLDLGCGLGKYTAAIAAHGLDVEGLDLTPALIEDLRARSIDFPVHTGDVADPPPELEGRFDLAVGFFFLHHVRDLTSIFTGTRNVLKGGGAAAFLEPNPLFPGFYVQITLTPGMRWSRERGIFDMRPAPVERAARAAGFTRFGHRAFGALPPFLVNRSWGRSLERTLESLPGWDRIAAFRLFTLS